MAYSSGIQNYIGVPSQQLNLTSNINGSFSNLNIDSNISPTNDTVDIGRQTKRFRKAYINEIDISTDGSINDNPSYTFDGANINKTKFDKDYLSPIVVGKSAASTDGLTACIIHPVSRIIVAIGCDTSGANFKCYTSNSIDTDNGENIWLERTISLPTSAGAYYPRFLVYDSVNLAYVAFNNATSTEYYYCPESNLDAWEVRTIPSTFTTGAGYFVYNGIGYTFITGSSSMKYTIDHITWTTFSLSNYIGATILPTPQDMLERPDWQEGEFDRYILLTSTAAGQGFSLWMSTSPIGPFAPYYSINASGNLRTILYNPYYKTLFISKSATNHLSVYQYYPNVNKAPTVLTQSNTVSAPTFLTFQNQSYLSKSKKHIFSLSSSSSANWTTGSYEWDGQSVPAIFARNSTANNAIFFSSQGVWTIDQTNQTAYAAGKKNATTFPNNSQMYIYKISFSYAPSSISHPLSSVSGVTNANMDNYLVGSRRILIDKYDRLVSLSNDKITGGIGSSSRPVKSIYFNQSLSTVGRNGLIDTRSSAHDTFIANTNHETLLADPSLNSKSLMSMNLLKTLNWSSASTTTAFTANQLYAIKYLGNGSLTGCSLNKLFAISVNGGDCVVTVSENGGAKWNTFTKIPAKMMNNSTTTTKYTADIAYSPTLNVYVLSIAHDNSAGFSESFGDRCTFYSRDGGNTWFTCKFETYVSVDASYGMVRWVPEWGNSGMFVLLASINTNTTTLHSIQLSEDGMNWRVPSSAPTSMHTISTTNRLVTGYDYDPSRNLLVASRRKASVTDSSFLTYSTDGETWTDATTNTVVNINAATIQIYDNLTFPPNGNNRIDWKWDGSGTLTLMTPLTIPNGVYSPTELAAEIANQMTTVAAVATAWFTGFYDYATGIFTFTSGTSDNDNQSKYNMQFLPGTGANTTNAPWALLGFRDNTDTSIENTIQSSSTFPYGPVFYHPTITNNRIDFRRNGVAQDYLAQIIPRCYTPPDFVQAVVNAINKQWVAAGFTAVTGAWNSGSGINTITSTQNMDYRWLSGPNTATNCYAEFGVAKVDVNNTLSMTSTIAQHHDPGSIRHVAYSPTLDIWVMVGTNTGTTACLSSNVWYSKDLINTYKSNNYGWTPVDVFQPSAPTTLRGMWTDVIWADSIQLFLLFNVLTTGGVNDKSIWCSRDGKTFSIASGSPQISLSVSALNSYHLQWDNTNHSLIPFNTGGVAGTSISYYTFSQLSKVHFPSLPGYQYGTNLCPSNNPAPAGTAVSWSFTFPTPFTVTPNYILYNFITPSAIAAYSFTSSITAKTTTTFTVTAVGSAGAAATGAPTIMWQAWE